MSRRKTTSGSGSSGAVVAESCFELLHIEMVQLIYRQNEDKQTAQRILDDLGAQVGTRLIERLVKDTPRLCEPLEIIKFVCKEFWKESFNRQVDKLQTNYKGTYVLHDYNFRWAARLSSVSVDAAQLKQEALKYCYFACGMIRGALDNLGMTASVRVDVSNLPACQFHIDDQRSGAA